MISAWRLAPSRPTYYSKNSYHSIGIITLFGLPMQMCLQQFKSKNSLVRSNWWQILKIDFIYPEWSASIQPRACWEPKLLQWSTKGQHRGPTKRDGNWEPMHQSSAPMQETSRVRCIVNEIAETKSTTR